MCDRVQPVVDHAGRDHGGDKGEVLLVYLLVNNSRIVYLQLVWASTRFQAGGLGGFCTSVFFEGQGRSPQNYESGLDRTMTCE